jgi:hypothetical protein
MPHRFTSSISFRDPVWIIDFVASIRHYRDYDATIDAIFDVLAVIFERLPFPHFEIHRVTFRHLPRRCFQVEIEFTGDLSGGGLGPESSSLLEPFRLPAFRR